MENIKNIITELEEKVNTKVKRQKKLNVVEKKDFRRRELLEKYTAKILYKWNDKKFKDKYLKKLEKN